MTHKKYQQHRSHQMIIDWTLTNAHGNPALVCAECKQKTGRRKGQNVYIDWLNRTSIEMLTTMGVEQKFN